MEYGLFTGFLGLALVFLLIVTAVLWIFVPFAVFGIKSILRDILKELHQANELTKRSPPASEHLLADASQSEASDEQEAGTLGTIRAAIKQASKP